jgi:hypothetical protein
VSFAPVTLCVASQRVFVVVIVVVVVVVVVYFVIDSVRKLLDTPSILFVSIRVALHFVSEPSAIHLLHFT